MEAFIFHVMSRGVDVITSLHWHKQSYCRTSTLTESNEQYKKWSAVAPWLKLNLSINISMEKQ